MIVPVREQPPPPSPRPRDAAAFPLVTSSALSPCQEAVAADAANPSVDSSVTVAAEIESEACDKRPPPPPLVEAISERAKEKIIKPKECGGCSFKPTLHSFLNSCLPSLPCSSILYSSLPPSLVPSLPPFLPFLPRTVPLSYIPLSLHLLFPLLMHSCLPYIPFPPSPPFSMLKV